MTTLLHRRGRRCLPYLVLLFAAAAAAAPPDVLFVVADDLRCDLGCYGADHVLSPHLDRLAAGGRLFRRAYCQQAVCNPSRASVMTGLDPWTLGVYDLHTHFRERRKDVLTLPQAFKAAGYHARGIGKVYHNWVQENRRGDAPSWSVPQMMHYANHSDDVPFVGRVPANRTDLPKCFDLDVPDEAYFDGRIADLAVAAIEAEREEPLFLAVGFWKPHSPFNAPAKYWDLYDRQSLPDVATPRPEGVPDVAMHDGREILRAFRKRPGKRPTDAEARAMRHGYYAAISYLDAQVGKLLDAVERTGRETVVVFWSDHGYHLGEKTLWAKTSNFELDARVPLIVAGPGIRPGETDALAELCDLYPTLAERCGVDAPADLGGVSLVPVLDDPSASVRDAAFTWHPRPAYVSPGEEPDVMGRSVRTDRYRYTQWRTWPDGKVVAEELYDHAADPAESRNAAGDEQLDAFRWRIEREFGTP